MRIELVLGVMLLGGTAHAADPWTAQSLVAKNLEARGGASALAAIKAVRFNGRMIFPDDFELAYKETRARTGDGSAARTDLSLQGLDVVSAYDGRNGWKINPFQGRKDAERMSADEARALADAALIDGPLQTAARDGSRVDYLGREDFDGTLAYKLKIAQKDGDEFVYLLDPDTFLEIKVDETRKVRGAPQTTETELGDYEKVGGVYFPMSVESWSEGQPNQRARLIIAGGEANPPIALTLFAEPTGQSPAKAGGEPPDASNQPPADAKSEQAPGQPASPPKGE